MFEVEKWHDVPKRFLRHAVRGESLLAFRFAREITQKTLASMSHDVRKQISSVNFLLICIPNLSCLTCDDIDWIRTRGSLIRPCSTSESRKTCLCLVMSERERNVIFFVVYAKTDIICIIMSGIDGFGFCKFLFVDSAECSVNELLTLGSDRSVWSLAGRLKLKAC